MKKDIEIAREANMLHIRDIAAKLNIDKEDIEWFLSLIVTIWLGVRKSPKTKEPQKRKRRKRK